MTETFFQAIGRFPAEDLQNSLNQKRISLLLMKKKENKFDIVVATKESPIFSQDELGVTDEPFSNA